MARDLAKCIRFSSFISHVNCYLSSCSIFFWYWISPRAHQVRRAARTKKKNERIYEFDDQNNYFGALAVPYIIMDVRIYIYIYLSVYNACHNMIVWQVHTFLVDVFNLSVKCRLFHLPQIIHHPNVFPHFRTPLSGLRMLFCRPFYLS